MHGPLLVDISPLLRFVLARTVGRRLAIVVQHTTKIMLKKNKFFFKIFRCSKIIPAPPHTCLFACRCPSPFLHFANLCATARLLNRYRVRLKIAATCHAAEKLLLPVTPFVTSPGRRKMPHMPCVKCPVTEERNARMHRGHSWPPVEHVTSKNWRQHRNNSHECPASGDSHHPAEMHVARNAPLV